METVDQKRACEDFVVQAKVKKRRVKFKPGSSLADTVNKISTNVEDNSTEEVIDFAIQLNIGFCEENYESLEIQQKK
ncbi:MAG TPA: hypothetical protein VKX31_01730 [Brumimicrobium sp.]|nr:hypothetical protein [Brumimicrobium sp.]